MTIIYDNAQLIITIAAVVCVLVLTYKLAVVLTRMSAYLSIKSADIIAAHDNAQFDYELNSLKTAVANAINRKAYTGDASHNIVNVKLQLDTTALSKRCIEQFINDYLLYNINVEVTDTYVHLESKHHVDIDSVLRNFNISTQQN